VDGHVGLVPTRHWPNYCRGRNYNVLSQLRAPVPVRSLRARATVIMKVPLIAMCSTKSTEGNRGMVRNSWKRPSASDTVAQIDLVVGDHQFESRNEREIALNLIKPCP
jgi:hypothetical protein